MGTLPSFRADAGEALVVFRFLACTSVFAGARAAGGQQGLAVVTWREKKASGTSASAKLRNKHIQNSLLMLNLVISFQHHRLQFPLLFLIHFHDQSTKQEGPSCFLLLCNHRQETGRGGSGNRARRSPTSIRYCGMLFQKTHSLVIPPKADRLIFPHRRDKHIHPRRCLLKQNRIGELMESGG